VFVDGAITPFNNPALQLVVMATAPPYGLAWPTGPDELLLVSVGTGGAEQPDPELEVGDLHLLRQVTASITGLMASVARQQDLMCRMLGACRFGQPIDLEVGPVLAGSGLVDPPLFSYVRYDLELNRMNLDALGCEDVEVSEVRPIDSVEHIDVLGRVGRAIAETQVDLAHFEGFVA
jgi:uncharacterized protein